ncbi:MerR family transcriptional regulator [Pediococcus siamensis]|uniref:MerR family transcriptional regulator n=1 Tax=Pediococcus siamensis TaxID=381829 RepID=UPI0039A03B20
MNNDFVQRVKIIMKQGNFLLGIGDIASSTGVSQRQLRYWEKKGYIHPAQSSDAHKHRKYAYKTLMKVSMIQSYIDSGYTLSMAVKKASQHEEMSNALKHLVGDRLLDFKIIADGYEVDFGQVVGVSEKKHLIAVIRSGHPAEFVLRELESDEQA